MTYDYKRHGATTLFAALSVLDGHIIAQCLPRHRHQEFLKFLNQIDRQTDPYLDIHLIVDTYCTHNHERVAPWLRRHQRFHLHFIPTSSSWLNLIECWFREIMDKRIRRGAFKSIPALIPAILEFIETHNHDPKPFVWSAPVDRILSKIAKCKEALLASA